MKDVHLRTDDGVAPGLLLGDTVHEIGTLTGAITGAFLADGDRAAIREAAERGSLPQHALADVSLDPPVAAPSKIVCIGLNNHDHAGERGAANSAEPVTYMKDPGTIVAHDATVLVPRDSVTSRPTDSGAPRRHLPRLEGAS